MGSVDFLDRFKGAMLGCAIGDAAGGLAGQLIDKSPEKLLDEGKAIEVLKDGLFEITHNAQIMVVMAQSLVETGRFSLPHTAFKFGKYMEYSDTGVKEATGIDEICEKACRRIYEERKFDKVGLPGEGICPAVRAVPVALRYFENLSEMLECTVSQVEITHSDPSTIGAALAVARTICFCLREKNEIKPQKISNIVAGFVKEVDPSLSALISRAFTNTGEIPDTKSFVADSGKEKAGYAHGAFLSALKSFVRFPFDFEKCLVDAMTAKTIASGACSIAGAFSGAYLGKSAIPSNLLEKLRGCQYIEGLALKLFTLTPASASQPRSFL